MKHKTIFARGAIAAGAFAIAASMFATPAAAQPNAQPKLAGTPVPKILVINREAILRLSKVGQDIVRQVNGYTQSAEKEFKGQGEQLRKDGTALQQQLAILAPDVKAKKIADFQNRERSLQAKVELRQQQIQGGVLEARQKIETALGPIVQGIMTERGATLLLDRGAIVWGTGDIDITRTAIQRLDQKMTTVKVNLVSPPKPKQG
ncbi:MAG TPA: OmpH family outer membrane protein [Rhizomicrobium sp.]|nr:OmpH family outer membrane protein [Rhizomicrobium sp.]